MRLAAEGIKMRCEFYGHYAPRVGALARLTEAQFSALSRAVCYSMEAKGAAARPFNSDDPADVEMLTACALAARFARSTEQVLPVLEGVPGRAEIKHIVAVVRAAELEPFAEATRASAAARLRDEQWLHVCTVATLRASGQDAEADRLEVFRLIASLCARGSTQ
jgi:hypothetical protein